MRRATAVPVLTWHANNIAGNDYTTNDHVAFREDLETIHRLGFQVVPLSRIASALRAGRLDDLRGCVGLSFDDGSDLDFYDAPHPAWGPQRSMANILADFRARHGADAQPSLHATSFVIVSPEARAILDRTCLVGCRWWNDDWWPLAEQRGIAIESHSWDHNHETLEETAASAPRGAFDLRSTEDANREIADASRWLVRQRRREGPTLFAYPWGEASDFLVNEYFPRHEAEHGVAAAFAGGSDFVRPDSSPWAIPRFVCGGDWKSTQDLEALLGECSATPVPQPALPGPTSRSSWRDSVRTWEVKPAKVIAGDLFERCFGHSVPDYGRHFVVMYSPPPGSGGETPAVACYGQWLPFEETYLGGGMCVDERIYRRMPKEIFAGIREAGGLATIVVRESIDFLSQAPAVFGYVGEPRARQADLRAGFVDAGRPNLMVIWLQELPESRKRELLDRVEALGPF